LKQQLTLRVDADILAWLRRGGKVIRRINNLLREAMIKDLKRSA